MRDQSLKMTLPITREHRANAKFMCEINCVTLEPLHNSWRDTLTQIHSRDNDTHTQIFRCWLKIIHIVAWSMTIHDDRHHVTFHDSDLSCAISGRCLLLTRFHNPSSGLSWHAWRHSSRVSCAVNGGKQEWWGEWPRHGAVDRLMHWWR